MTFFTLAHIRPFTTTKTYRLHRPFRDRPLIALENQNKDERVGRYEILRMPLFSVVQGQALTYEVKHSLVWSLCFWLITVNQIKIRE